MNKEILLVADAVSNEKGIDIPALIEWVGEKHVVSGFPGADAVDGAEVLAFPCNVLIPAALEEAITRDNAGAVQAEIVVEGANSPLTVEAHDLLAAAGVTVIPDILANAGGVTVSYFEWSQNIQQYRWEGERVVSELDKIMRRAYHDVAGIAQKHGVDLRTAAFILAIKRVVRAASLRRSSRQALPASLLS